MTRWVVLSPRHDRPDDGPVLVADSFRWLALIAPPLWLIWHRLWLEAAIVVAVLMSINALVVFGFVAPTFSMLSTLISLFVAFEGPAMRVAALRREGYDETTAVTARDQDDAETRYVAWLERGATAPARAAARVPVIQKGIGLTHPSAPTLGLFQYPGKS